MLANAAVTNGAVSKLSRGSLGFASRSVGRHSEGPRTFTNWRPSFVASNSRTISRQRTTA